MEDVWQGIDEGVQKPLPQRSRLRLWFVAGFSLLVVGIAIAYICIEKPFNKPDKVAARPISVKDAPKKTPVPPNPIDDPDEPLQSPVIVPTLDSPIPEGKSVIWCASFQLAWNRLKDDVAKVPIQLANAQPIADRLNNASKSAEGLELETAYSAAGLAKDGIVERIKAEMARKFPNVPAPELEVPQGGAVAYAYLAASSKFEFQFLENDQALQFVDSSGKKTAVKSFGVRRKDNNVNRQLRQQILVLYRDQSETRPEEPSEFILDPSRNSQPYQIVLARLDRKATLFETLADIERKIAAEPPLDEYHARFGPNDSLLIPNIACAITHHFKDLEGKEFSNPALRELHLDTALQSIQFRLDHNGAELATEAKMVAKGIVSHFNFNRPFLIYMKKRDSKQPFFVAWIENAELMERK